MGVFAGPNIPKDSIFSVDGRNIESFPNNGKIKSLVSSEEKNTTSTVQDGYIYSNNGFIDKFKEFSISESSAITVNIGVDNSQLKSGTAFAIYSDSIGYRSSGITSYSSGVTTTVSLGTTSHSLTLNVSGITSYSSGVTTTVSLGTTSHSLTLNVSGITSYSSGVTTTVSSGIFPSFFNPAFELSASLFPTFTLITNKNSNNASYLSQSLETQGKDIYSIVFRTLGSGISPISLYKNGTFLSNSGIATGTTQFENVGISLFGLSNGDYSQYGIRFISIYGRELSGDEIILINNLKTN